MERKRRGIRVVIANLVVVFLIGFVDYLSGYQISFSIFYLIPILIVVWRTGLWEGIFISVVSAVTWAVADNASGNTYTSPLILYWNSAVRLSFFFIVSYMFSKLRSLYEREKKISRTDFLTGLANLRAFYDAVEEEIGRAKRYKHPFTVAYIDLDNFKSVNDQYGHQTGDKLLANTAKVIKDDIRAIDVAGRLGGDEFALLMPETALGEEVVVLERLREKLLDIMKKHGWPVTFSIGAATFKTPPESVKEVITKADDIMYYVKTTGKDRIKHEIF